MGKMKFDQVYLTNLPSFYKIKLYNEIAKSKKIIVIYTMDSLNIRNKDFFAETPFYRYVKLSEGLSGFKKALLVLKELSRIEYNELIIGGWDSLSMWMSVLYSPRKKNSVVIESSIYDSKIDGLRGFLKKIFLNRINKAYVSGALQKKLLEELNFTRTQIITKGVGLYNRVDRILYEPKKIVRNFIYVGRLSNEKNVLNLIRVFNKLPNLNLTIIGYWRPNVEILPVLILILLEL